jgi:hypothetical protein
MLQSPANHFNWFKSNSAISSGNFAAISESFPIEVGEYPQPYQISTFLGSLI